MYDSAFKRESIMDISFITQIGVWANVASAFFTMFTAGAALFALRQWREQYLENKFLRFVDAVIEYNNCLIRAPKSIAQDTDDLHRKALSVSWAEMHMRWIICLKTKRGRQNRELIEAMKVVACKHRQFLSGEIIKLELSAEQIITIAVRLD